MWGEGTVLRPWRLATLTIAASPWRTRTVAGWIPADVAGAADDLVTLHDRIWGIVSIGPIVAHPTTDHPRWPQARRFPDPEDQCARE